MTARALLLIGLGILALYMIPSAVARYAGSHTWELNETAGVEGVNCVKCHDYVRSELNQSSLTRPVFEAHRNAAGNQSYTSGWLNLTIDNTTAYGACFLCHLNQLSATASHTKVTLRVCTDLDCHGTNATTNNTAYDAGSMGPRLGGPDELNPTNVHMRMFNQMYNVSSGYLNETGSDYKQGFYLCLGCHTQANIEIVREGSEEYDHTDPDAAQRRYL